MRRPRAWAMLLGLLVLAGLGAWLRGSAPAEGRTAGVQPVDRPSSPEPALPASPGPQSPAQPAGRVAVEPALPDPPVASPADSAATSAADDAVRLRFVDEQGSPLAGVELALLDSDLGPARSGRDGEAWLSLDDLLAGGARTLALEARAPGFALEQRRVRAEERGELLLGDWILVAGGSVEGRVVDEEGAGLAGIQVACFSAQLTARDFARLRRAPLERLARAGARASTGPDGVFRLDDVPAGELRLVAVCDDRPAALSRSVHVPIGGLAGGIEIEMEPADGGTIITGIVLAPDGAPVAHAPFQVHSPASSYQLRAGLDGRFEFRALDRRPVEIVASDPEQRHRDARLAGVVPGTRGIELRLGAAPQLVLAVQGPAQEAIERFAVRIRSEPALESLAAFPAEEHAGGRFASAVPEVAYRVEVLANGWKPGLLGPFEAGVEQRLTCVLAPARGLHGVVSADGRALAGARLGLHAVLASDDSFQGLPLRIEPEPLARTESGPDGGFLLTVEAPGTFALLVEADGHALAERGPFRLGPDEEQEVDVELDDGGGLAIRVRSAQGASVGGRLVVLSRGDGRARTLRTDEHGQLEVPRLTPGPWWVALADAEITPGSGARSFGTGPREAFPSNCDVLRGQVARFELWLEGPPGEACRLEGQLLVDGTPARGWQAALDREGAVVVDGLAFHEPGRFRVGVATPGTYRLRLSTGADDPQAMLVILDTIELVEGERAWSLDVRTGRLEGTFPLPAEALVFFRIRDGRRELLAPLVSDAMGRFRCALAPAGDGEIVRHDTVSVSEEPRSTLLRSVTVVPGRTTTIDR